MHRNDAWLISYTAMQSSNVHELLDRLAEIFKEYREIFESAANEVPYPKSDQV